MLLIEGAKNDLILIIYLLKVIFNLEIQTMKEVDLQEPLVDKGINPDEELKQKEDSYVKVKKHNPLLAITLQMTAVLCYAFAKLVSKILFIMKPEMDTFM